MKHKPDNLDSDKIYQYRQDQLKRWDEQCIWRGLFMLTGIVSAGLFLL